MGVCQILPVIGDPMFEFPDISYWKNLLDGRKVDMSAEEMKYTNVQQVISAVKKLFHATSLRISPHASQTVQLSEVADVASRLLESQSTTSRKSARDFGTERSLIKGTRIS